MPRMLANASFDLAQLAIQVDSELQRTSIDADFLGGCYQMQVAPIEAFQWRIRRLKSTLLLPEREY